MKENENKREKKFSKKKVMIVTGMALLLALVGYAGGSTYARYLTSQTTQSQTATVAKWGYVVSANASNLFATEYKNGTTTTAEDADKDVAIQSGSSAKGLVAPGTGGSFSFTIAGQAEVLAGFDITLTGTEVALTYDLDPAAAPDAVVYKPMKWTLTKDNSPVTGCESVSLDTIKTYLDTLDAVVKPNGTLAANGVYKLSWSWADDNADNADLDDLTVSKGGKNYIMDTNYDSVLGLLKDGYTAEGYSANFDSNVELTITIKQLQQDELASYQATKWNS